MTKIVRNLNCLYKIISQIIISGYYVRLFKKKVQELTQSIYNQIKPRVVFVLNLVLRLKLKDPISYLDKSCVYIQI